MIRLFNHKIPDLDSVRDARSYYTATGWWDCAFYERNIINFLEKILPEINNPAVEIFFSSEDEEFILKNEIEKDKVKSLDFIKKKFDLRKYDFSDYDKNEMHYKYSGSIDKEGGFYCCFRYCPNRKALVLSFDSDLFEYTYQDNFDFIRMVSRMLGSYAYIYDEEYYHSPFYIYDPSNDGFVFFSIKKK